MVQISSIQRSLNNAAKRNPANTATIAIRAIVPVLPRPAVPSFEATATVGAAGSLGLIDTSEADWSLVAKQKAGDFRSPARVVEPDPSSGTWNSRRQISATRRRGSTLDRTFCD